jgi:hypothetical protein
MPEEDEPISTETLPIYKKGKEIFKLVEQICHLIPLDNEHLQLIR